jgi:hypothetical protein
VHEDVDNDFDMPYSPPTFDWVWRTAHAAF